MQEEITHEVLHNFTGYDNDWSLCQLLFKEGFWGARNTKISYGSNVVFWRRVVFTIGLFEYFCFEILELFYCFTSDFDYLCVDFFSVVFLFGRSYYKKESLWDWIDCVGKYYHCLVVGMPTGKDMTYSIPVIIKSGIGEVRLTANPSKNAEISIKSADVVQLFQIPNIYNLVLNTTANISGN